MAARCPRTLPLEVQQAVLAAGEFAARVRLAREERRWSRAALGRAAGVSSHVVGNVEDGHAWPDLITMSLLARALGLTVRLMALAPAEAGAVTQALGAARGLSRPVAAGDTGSSESVELAAAAEAIDDLLKAVLGLREAHRRHSQ